MTFRRSLQAILTTIDDQYVITGVKPNAMQSILEHERIKASHYEEMGRGESDCSNTKTKKPMSWGFCSYNSRVFQHATWVYLGNGLYMQTWLELESAPGKNLIAKGNAGIPRYVDGHINYNGTPD